MRRGACLLLIALSACSRSPDPPSRPSASAAATSAETSAALAPPPPSASARKPIICDSDDSNAHFFVAPREPVAGVPLRIFAFSNDFKQGSLIIEDKNGESMVSNEDHGGPPYWWYAEIPSPRAGPYNLTLRRDVNADLQEHIACRTVLVKGEPEEPPPRARGVAWPVKAAWNKRFEDMYSVWIEKLFDAPLDKQLAWSALHEVLRDRGRNFLYDYLGAGEDGGEAPGTKKASVSTPLLLKPDCADLPYFLRAYFAFKMGLPFGYSSCTRGGGGRAPQCNKWRSNLEPRKARRSAAATFGEFLRVTLADTVHSGTGRIDGESDNGDYYPVKLSWEALRPGTIFADPYGHVLVVAKRVEQTPERAGLLFAVDGQPDGTVARRRFWRGNFLFALGPGLGGAGFKRFRPVVMNKGKLMPLSNADIKASPDYGDYSLEQYGAGVEGFYDAMDRVLSPSPLDPERAMLETIDALDEQVQSRALSVANAKKHFKEGGGEIEMPKGASIFETSGPWEDYSTPSRDLRLLIAIDIVRGFPERFLRRPDRFAMPEGKSAKEVREALEELLKKELAKRHIFYEQSNGSAFELSLSDVLARAKELEMGYNPNDCPELRWGAPSGSEEAKTCRRWATPAQRAEMRRYRKWFRERKRPPRE